MTRQLLPGADLFGYTQCANCDIAIHQDAAFVKNFYRKGKMVSEHFCGESCHQAWYIKQLNQSMRS